MKGREAYVCLWDSDLITIIIFCALVLLLISINNGISKVKNALNFIFEQNLLLFIILFLYRISDTALL